MLTGRVRRSLEGPEWPEGGEEASKHFQPLVRVKPALHELAVDFVNLL